MSAKPDRARIIAPPPLLGLGCIGAGFAANHFKPLPLFLRPSPLGVLLGIGLIIAAVVTIFVARRVFVAHGTHVNPYRPTTALAVTGLYGFSRNPIYVAFLVIVAAFSLIANSLWFLAATVLLFLLLHFGVIKREELYLADKFGDAYSRYRSKVRRWI